MKLRIALILTLIAAAAIAQTKLAGISGTPGTPGKTGIVCYTNCYPSGCITTCF